MAITYATLFDQLATIFEAQDAINTSRGSTLPPLFQAILDEFDSTSLELQRAIDTVEPASRSYHDGGADAMEQLRAAAISVLIETVAADASIPLPEQDLTAALEVLCYDMAEDSASVDASAVAASASANDGNGDGAMVVSAKRADGRLQENAFAETIRVICTDATDPATAAFVCEADPAVSDQLSSAWPGGSGTSETLTATSASSSLLTNGGFDDEDDIANAPDDWIVSVGTIGTTIKMTDYEVQTITVTGPPTAGTYRISWANQANQVQVTAPLAYDASAADVQAALRALEGLELVEVTSSGTSPLFTHTITFTGVAGNLNQITILNNTTGGTYTPATSSAGSANAFVGKAVEFDSNGSELTTLNQPVALEPLTQYGFCVWMKTDSTPAAGVITIDLVDGIGGTVIADEAGTSNSFTVAANGLTTSFVAKTGVFRTPRVLPPTVYLRIRISTAVSNTSSVFIDHASLVEMTELYPGGPAAAIFSGATPFASGGVQVNPDTFTITVTNDAAGKFQQAFERNFDMRAKGLLLPSDASGSETITDY